LPRGFAAYQDRVADAVGQEAPIRRTRAAGRCWDQWCRPEGQTSLSRNRVFLCSRLSFATNMRKGCERGQVHAVFDGDDLILAGHAEV